MQPSSTVKSNESQRPSLLLVEDNVIAGEGVRLALTEHGFEVRVVHAGRDALEQLDRHGADVVVLDLTLPDLDGVALAEMMRRDRPDLPIIVVSGHARPARVTPLLLNRQTAFLQKPYQLSELLAAIDVRMNRRVKSSYDRAAEAPDSRDRLPE